MSDDWILARFEVLGDGEILDWAMPLMERLGLDPKDFRPQVTLATGPVMHLSKFLRDDQGEKRPDLNLSTMATEPVVVQLTPDDLPPWLKE